MSILLFPIRELVVFIEEIIVKLFINLSVFASKMPFNRFYLPIPPTILIITYYALIFALIRFYKTYKFTFLKYVLNTKFLKRKIIIKKEFIKKIVIILMIIICFFKIIEISPKDLIINFLDVRTR